MASNFEAFDIQVNIEIDNTDFFKKSYDFGELLSDLRQFIKYENAGFEYGKNTGEPVKTAYKDEINEFILGLTKIMKEDD